MKIKARNDQEDPPLYVAVNLKFVVLDARPQLKDLHNLVSPEYAAGWRNIGAFLGLSCGLLNIIEYDCHHKAEDCCNAVWEQWLDMGGAATRYKVIQAIDSLQAASLVDANKTLPARFTNIDVICHANNHVQNFYIKERYKMWCNNIFAL